MVSGNGLVPSGNKPLPEAMLTKVNDILFLQETNMGVVSRKPDLVVAMVIRTWVFQEGGQKGT